MAMPPAEDGEIRKTSALASISLILGVSGIPFVGLTSIPGLFLGIAGLRSIRRSNGRLLGKGLAIAGIAASAVTLAFGVTFHLYLRLARETPQLPVSIANLEKIGTAIIDYRKDSYGGYPPDLKVLLKKGYLNSPKVLLDPADKTPAPVGPGGPRCSYEYVGAVPVSTPGEAIIAYSRRGLYQGGRFVLYADCAVAWVNADKLRNSHGNPRTSLRDSYEVVLKAFGDNLTEERKAELRKFYEVEG